MAILLVLWCTYLRCRHVCTFLKKIPVRYVNLIPALQHFLKFLGLCAGPLRLGRTKSNKILISTFLIHMSSIHFRARKHNNQSLTFVCFVKVSSNSRFSPFVLTRAHSTNTLLLCVADRVVIYCVSKTESRKIQRPKMYKECVNIRSVVLYFF